MSVSPVEITAIVCTHNRLDVLPKAIESLLGQSLPSDRYEVLVVDNASTDGTGEHCARYRDRRGFRYVFEPVPGLSQARNRGLAEARGSYVAYMDDDAIASHGWLESLLRAFREVTPAPVSVGGRIDPIWEAPKPEWLPDQKKPYLTVLDYGERPFFLAYPKILYGTNMAFEREALLAIGGFRTDVGRVKHCLLSGEEMEVYRQLAEKKLPVYYLPCASVRHLVPEARLTKKWLHSRHYWQGRSEILVFPEDSSRHLLKKEVRSSVDSCLGHFSDLFRGLFRETDPTFSFSHTASLCQQLGRVHQLFVKLNEPPRPDAGKNRMLVIARSLPRYDRGSGHLRLFHILEILAHHHEIVYYTENYTSNKECDDEVYVNALCGLGIEVVKEPGRLDALLDSNFSVVLFEFYDTAIRHLAKVKAGLPSASTIIDTVDVHFAREIQMANVHGDREMLRSALETKRKELEIYQQCDLVWAVTDEDRKALLEEVDSLKVDIVPNIHKFPRIDRSAPEKNSLLFIGNFWHQPNEDAVLYFCTEILPLIRRDVPDLVVYIVGNAPTENVKRMADQTVKVVGWVPETAPYLERCQVSIVPLRYGAGMKGKVGEAMSAGIPVVTTPIGVQGMDVRDGEEILVADSAESFARSVKKLLADKDLFARVSSNAMSYIKQRYDFDVVAGSVVASVANAPRPEASPLGAKEMAGLLWQGVLDSRKGVQGLADAPDRYSDGPALRSFKGIGGVQTCHGDEVFDGQRIFTKVFGNSPAGHWSFARTGKYRLEASAKYELKALMLIRSLTASTSFFKCEVFNGSQWLQNFDSSRYDTTKMGTWQELSTVFTLPPDISPVIQIAIEKRPHDSDAAAEVFIGKLELREVR